MTIDVDRLAREHVASVHREFPSAGGRITSYQFSPAQLTAYTRAVLEEAAKACEQVAERHLQSGRYVSVIADHAVRAGGQIDGSEECAAEIRKLMP